MRVLIVATDLYASVGGGQTVYRSIIAANPGIEFVYFRSAEPARTVRPRNASCVPLRAAHRVQRTGERLEAVALRELRRADGYARSVAGQDFDVVELPDYLPCGAYLRD